MCYLYPMGSAIKPIYLDYHATTPVDPDVLDTMLPYFSERFGNPASRSHAYGWQASEAVEIARAQVAELIQADVKDIFFTSGATEGLNMAIKGLADAAQSLGKHIVTLRTEHHAVLDATDWLKRIGYEVTMLPVNREGMVDPDQLRNALRPDTIMVIIMWANNETGVIQDMKVIGAICKQAGVMLVCDATQAAGKIEINPLSAGIDIVAFSAHKMYGPKGIGALYINQRDIRIKPTAMIHGGGHERGFRSGTLNVPGIVGFGAAALRCSATIQSVMHRLGEFRDRFEKDIINTIEEVSINGNIQHRLPTVSNLQVRFVDSQAVMTRFRSQLAISSGSACSSAHPEPSHVLLAMGLSPDEARGSFRISFGIPSTAEEVDRAIQIFKKAIAAERAQSPVWQMFKEGVDLS